MLSGAFRPATNFVAVVATIVRTALTLLGAFRHNGFVFSTKTYRVRTALTLSGAFQQPSSVSFLQPFPLVRKN
jgi:hypothetical protein